MPHALAALRTTDPAPVRDALAAAISPVVALLTANTPRSQKATVAADGKTSIALDLAALFGKESTPATTAAAAASALAVLAQDDAYTGAVVALGGVRALVPLLVSPGGPRDSRLQDSAALALAVLAEDTSSHSAIATQGAVGPLVSLLPSAVVGECEAAVLALAYLTRTPAIARLVAGTGGLYSLVSVVRFGCTEARANAAYALGNLAADAALRPVVAEVAREALLLLRDGGRLEDGSRFLPEPTATETETARYALRFLEG